MLESYYHLGNGMDGQEIFIAPQITLVGSILHPITPNY